MRRIMVVHTELILGRVVQRLLSGMAGLEVIGYDPRDQADLLQAVRSLEPDDVLLTRGIMDLADLSELLMSQGSDSKMRVIIISPYENLVHIYDRRQMAVSSAVELFTLILDD